MSFGEAINKPNKHRKEDWQIDMNAIETVGQDVVEAERQILASIAKHALKVVNNGVLGQIDINQVLRFDELVGWLGVCGELDECLSQCANRFD